MTYEEFKKKYDQNPAKVIEDTALPILYSSETTKASKERALISLGLAGILKVLKK